MKNVKRVASQQPRNAKHHDEIAAISVESTVVLMLLFARIPENIEKFVV